MELENIKSLWDKEEISETPEVSLEKQKEIRMPLEKIRQNMKTEFWMSVGVLPIFLVYIVVIKDLNRLFFLGVAFVSFLVIIAYYFYKFFRLYKKIETQEFKTYHSLLNLRYELILNTELYKSYYIASVVVLLSFFLTMFVGRVGYSSMLMFSFSFFIAILIMFLMGKIWLKELYGKYIIQISDLVDEMTDENSGLSFNRARLETNKEYKLFNTTKTYFSNKFGKKGAIINTIFWSVLIIALLLIFSFIVGYAIGSLGVKFNMIDKEMIEGLKK